VYIIFPYLSGGVIRISPTPFFHDARKKGQEKNVSTLLQSNSHTKAIVADTAYIETGHFIGFVC
jgi:hypothetical protein